MVLILKTTDPEPTDTMHQEWLYNGLDSCVTLEVLDALLPQLDEVTGPAYYQALELQAPILEMECRGVRVDKARVGAVRHKLETQRAYIEEALTDILTNGVGIDISMPPPAKGKEQSRFWNSPAKLKELFYETLALPPVRQRGQITTNRKALEKLRGYFFAEPIVNHILALRDLNKKLGVLKTGIDSDGRIRTSYNIAGTDTGRLSSYASAFGTGTNLQNITAELRDIFVADPGKKLAYIDLEQAESRAVGAIIWNLFKDGTYLDFCESGDLHTNVCKMIWRNMPWTGDMTQDKKIAQQKFYRDFDYRDMSKRGGHGSNYGGKPPHMARELRVPVPLMEEFQKEYFGAFPGIPAWHQWVRDKLRRDGWITTFMGRRRWFFGRRWEDETVRAATAYEPQGGIADYMNRGLYRLWRSNLGIEIMLQVHDAVVFQYPEEIEDEVIPAARSIISWEVPLLHGRSLIVPTDAMTGWNWGKYDEVKNPGGMKKYTGGDTRKRPDAVGLLDRKFY